MSRAVSTVVDVGLAMLLISASVVLIGFAMQDDAAPDHEPEQADYAAETFASLTLNVTYSLEPIKDDNGSRVCSGNCTMFDEANVNDDTDTYRRSVHGSAPALVADAAVTTAEFPHPSGRDAPLTKAGADYERSLEGAVRDRMTGAHNRTQIVALWRPYERGSIEGEVEIGPSPPADADVSTAQLTVPSGVPPVDEDRLERQYRLDGFEGAASVVADAIVRGYFPPEETQLALEDEGFRRERAVYRYRRAGNMYDVNWGLSSYLFDSHVSRYDADARAANDELRPELADAIAADLRASDHYDGVTADELSDRVSTGEVTIIIRTW